MTSVGAVIARSSAVRSPEAMIAASWRPVPAAVVVAVEADSAATLRDVLGVRGMPGEPTLANSCAACSMNASRSRGAGAGRSGSSRARAARPAAAGVGHDRHQRAHALRVACGERLGDHPAHRGPDHVRRCELELAQQPGRVLGHVGERVARRAPGAAQQLAERRRRALQMGRAADVAVVEADHVQPARRRAARRNPPARRPSACRGP